MSRRWLVAVSLVVHAVVGVGLFASGVWHIERVEAGRRTVEIGQPLPMPEPGGPVAAEQPEIKPKETKPIAKLVQPPVTPPEVPDFDKQRGSGEGSGSGSGEGSGSGTCKDCDGTPDAITRAPDPVCGDGSLAGSEQCDDGNTASGDGCSSTCRHEPRIVTPNVLRALRVSGETQVHPSPATQNLILRDGTRSVQGMVKVCLASDGTVVSATMQSSTRYPDYDRALLAAVRGWRYQPYTVNGTAIAACSTVTFLYSIQ